MELVNDIAEQYAKQFSSPLHGILQEIADFTMQHHPHAHMLSGHVQGKVLEMLSAMLQPEHILEIGTFTGFSALCLLKGLKAGGTLHTIELRASDAATAKKYFDKKPKNKVCMVQIISSWFCTTLLGTPPKA